MVSGANADLMVILMPNANAVVSFDHEVRVI